MADEGWVGLELNQIRKDLQEIKEQMAVVARDNDAFTRKLDTIAAIVGLESDTIKKSYILDLSQESDLAKIGLSVGKILAYVSPQPPKPPAGFTAALTIDLK